MREDGHGEWDVSTSTRGLVHRERRRRRRFYVRIVAWAALGVVVAGLMFVGTALFTDRPSFCTTCHEMQPYYEAWGTGSHSKVSCVECHVAPGIFARFAHKFSALGEVRSHFVGDTRFPRPHPAYVPDSRCLTCHTSLPEKTATGFLHSQHAARGTCAACHPHAGHEVSDTTLKQAGVFSGRTAPAAIAGALAIIGGGVANLPGHQPIDCSRCHNLAETGCQRCHVPRHAARGACGTCHLPGATWVFTHPKEGVDCSMCHKLPAADHIARKDCLTCHPAVGVSWKRKHIVGQECGDCHVQPAGHRVGSCSACHKKPGVDWSFVHPGASADCAGCHARPSGHKPGACNSCHTNAGKSWAFAHPAAPGDCAACHSRPANHYAGTCMLCHKHPGATFAFAHPASHHSWRSRPCVKCHPNGYTSHFCTCHGGGR